jgi:hypothetical protein
VAFEMEKAGSAAAVSRRSVFSGLFIVAAAAASIPTTRSQAARQDRIRKAAEALASAMAEEQGGQYWIHIDQDCGVTAVSRIFSKVSATPSA